ncbi:conjugal transfer protein [Streptomyces sp. NPDC007264]|uniref:conjugal transfer protein n=1 Tax=Streptomyces sp. NPDC007264 TaxID=3364777 RepID=UPI0036DECD63
MLIRQSARSGGRSRSAFRRGKAAEPAPPDAWPPAAPAAAQEAAAQEAAGEAEAGKGKGKAGEKGRKKGGKKGGDKGGDKAGQADASAGNGWFHNPFARPGTATAAGDRSGVSSAQMWAGPRRGILVRRLLGAFAVLLLLFLFAKVNGKASKADVRAEVDARVRSSARTFPRGAAQLWAAPLVKLFTTYDPDHADDRSRALEPYAINGLDAQLGWNGQGAQSVIDMVVSDDVQVTGRSQGVVRATVQVQDGSWRCVAVPVYTVERGGSTAFGLTSAPVYVPCAGLTTPPRGSSESTSNDTDLAGTFKDDLLPPFLAAWAQSDTDNLNRYLLPGTVSFGLGGAYTGSDDGGRPKVDNVYIPQVGKGGDAAHRTVTFTTTLLSTDGKAAQTSTYQVAVVQKNGQWYFASDPTPAVGSAGGDQLPDVQPSQGTGGMYSHSPAPYPGATTSTDVQQPTPGASTTP